MVPLPTKRSKAVRLAAPVPPLATGRMPVTLVVKSMVELVISPFTIREEDKSPAELLCTTPAVLKAVTVGAWETVRLVIVVVAKVEVPVTERVPPTVSRLEIVVLPVMPNVLEAEVQVKLPEPPVVVAAV